MQHFHVFSFTLLFVCFTFLTKYINQILLWDIKWVHIFLNMRSTEVIVNKHKWNLAVYVAVPVMYCQFSVSASSCQFESIWRSSCNKILMINLFSGSRACFWTVPLAKTYQHITRCQDGIIFFKVQLVSLEK